MGKQLQRQKKNCRLYKTFNYVKGRPCISGRPFSALGMGICAVEKVNVDKGGVSDGICIFYR